MQHQLQLPNQLTAAGTGLAPGTLPTSGIGPQATSRTQAETGNAMAELAIPPQPHADHTAGLAQGITPPEITPTGPQRAEQAAGTPQPELTAVTVTDLTGKVIATGPGRLIPLHGQHAIQPGNAGQTADPVTSLCQP